MAATLKMPFASTVKSTRTRGIPAAAAGSPPAEARERPVVLHEFPLPLHHVDVDSGLPIDMGSSGKRLQEWPSPRDQALGESPHDLDPQRQRHHIDQEHVFREFGLTAEDVGLDGSAKRDDWSGSRSVWGVRPKSSAT